MSIGIIGFSGQSNMEGFRSDPSLIPVDTNDSNIPFSVYKTTLDGNGQEIGDEIGEYGILRPLVQADGGGNGWTTGITIPAGSSSWGFGPEISLCRAMYSEERPVAGCKWALGGQSLDGTFNPSPAGFGYTGLKNYMEGLEATLTSENSNPYWLAFVWNQGEEDATNPPQAANYEYNLRRLVKHVRAIAKNQHLPFLIVKTTTPAGASDISVVQAAQEKIAATMANVYIYDPTGLPLYSDNVHYWEDAQLTIGTALSQILINNGF